MTLNNMIYNELITDILWNVQEWKSDNDGYIVSLEGKKHEVIKYPPQMKNLVNLLLKFNYPLSKLSVRLDQTGLPVAILNQQEIYKNWTDVKINDLRGFENDESTKEIIIGGDMDFSNSLPIINNSIIYVLFFSPVFGHRKATKNKLQSFIQDSQLFPQNKINVEIDEFLIGESNVDIQF